MNWRSFDFWLHGLIGALVGGGASAITAIIGTGIVDPEHFNLQGGLHHLLSLMLTVFIINGIVSAALYLSKSPVPQWDGVDRRNGVAEKTDSAAAGK